MKTVLFIPGFYETLKDRDYTGVLNAFASKGYSTKFVPLKWKRTDLTHWLKEFNATYQNYEPNNTILAGFSFGAVTALVAAAERNPAELWLCSLSPYFAGDNPKKSWVKGIGKRRAQAFSNTNFTAIAKQINCPTKILYGALEGAEIEHRAVESHELIKSSVVIKVPDTKHDVAALEYIKAIKLA